ncbi:MAG TPA: sigma 54-interacting transcriptional regulator, partial [Polyangiaceae bacterium LLY-WYZ-15_(1-7)]|nr:sigma 54-interacting transcriptional regulator [Polyangiaceae bacterium LLY-WYZ-15_(1-7)]
AAALEDALGGDPHGVLESSSSPSVRKIVTRAKQVASTRTPVLITGETGTGKERLARAIHLWSERREQPFVTINCAAIPETLIESELFGHVKGAFTGATRDRPGRFQVANGGTLLLDEIGELPLALQAKLLRVLQEGTFQPVGSDQTRRVDVRVLAATHVDLEAAARKGRFREDLYYRLAVFPLQLPPLRERLEDLPALVEAMLDEQARRTGRRARADADLVARLRSYDWPGNLRELANVLERASILSPDGRLRLGDLDLPRRVAPLPPSRSSDGALPTLDEVQRQHVARVLKRTDGKIYGDDGAAALLGLKPSTLQSRMKKLGLDRADFT